MNEREQKPPVEPKLFLLLDRYAKDLEAGSVTGSAEPRSEVVTFCVNFFQQFLHNVAGIEITGINDESKATVIRRRLELGAGSPDDAVKRIMLMFQDLCDLWPDISQGTYWESEASFRQFHKVYIPRLLTRIADWGSSSGHEEIFTRATAAQVLFTSAIGRL
jgi:hypothetical protein